MLDKRAVKNIIKIKSKEFREIKNTFDMGLIRNAAFSVGTDFNSAQLALKDSKNIPLIIPFQSKLLSRKGEMDNYEPFKLTRYLTKFNLAVFLVASDREFLGGDPADIKTVKFGSEVSVIQHDFFIDEVQLYQAKSYGSDGIMLDSEFLNAHELARFADITFQLGMEPFLKIFQSANLKHIEPEIIGGIIIDKDNIEEYLESEFYQKIQGSTSSQFLLIVCLPWISNQDVESLSSRGIHHFLLSDEWLWRPKAMVRLERMIRKNWPDR